jgi:hypothetical protein
MISRIGPTGFLTLRRMGGSEEEAATAFAEGRALGESLGDRAALALLVGRYGLMRFSVAGSASDYARYGEEAASLARDCGDPKLRVAIGTLPAYGHFHAGRGPGGARVDGAGPG